MKIFLIKFLLAGTLAAVTFSTSSCNKDDDCTEVNGTYTGIESCPGSNINLTMVISESSQDNQVVISVSGTSIIVNGNVSSDCSQITIPSQNVSAFGGAVDGSLSLNGNNLTGALNFPMSSCSYNLNKQ